MSVDTAKEETNCSISTSYNQEELDEMLAVSIAAKENEILARKGMPFAVINHSEQEYNADEGIILPSDDAEVDMAVLAALPPSMQLDLLVQMRERLIAENRQKYQKVKKDPAKFSGLQIQAYLKTVAFRQGIVAFDNSVQVSNLDCSTSVSTSSLASSKTSATAMSSNITVCSMPYSVGSYQQMQQGSVLNLHQSPVRGKDTDREGLSALGRNDLVADLGDPLPKQYGFSINRSDDDEDV